MKKTRMLILIAAAYLAGASTTLSAKQIPVPKDLLDNPDAKGSELNEFTVPSIAKLFDTLKALAPLPLLKNSLVLPERLPIDRADLAMEMGFLIADGFIMVQNEQLDDIQNLTIKLNRYGKALGVGEHVNRHAAFLIESVNKKDVANIKKELAAMQKDVEEELISLRDRDLVHVVSLGGWIRALGVATAAVENQYTPERAQILMREDIADYFTETISGLDDKISDRPNYAKMREILASLRDEMITTKKHKPKLELIKKINEQAKSLSKLALERKQ